MDKIYHFSNSSQKIMFIYINGHIYIFFQDAISHCSVLKKIQGIFCQMLKFCYFLEHYFIHSWVIST